MTTAALRVAKNMVLKVERLRENDKVCLFCDAVEFIALLVFPLAIPFLIMHLSLLG
jgi:hypothetical protein|tara:strand:- start:5956 stop:6123 length:168 start_codon:yes stop_codon:yes gene_type:complete